MRSKITKKIEKGAKTTTTAATTTTTETKTTKAAATMTTTAATETTTTTTAAATTNGSKTATTKVTNLLHCSKENKNKGSHFKKGSRFLLSWWANSFFSSLNFFPAFASPT